MKIRNEYLFNGILPGETEEKIISTLDKADKWNSLSQSVRRDFWRMSKREIRKKARRLDRIANEIVQDLIDWKQELSLFGRGETAQQTRTERLLLSCSVPFECMGLLNHRKPQSYEVVFIGQDK